MVYIDQALSAFGVERESTEFNLGKAQLGHDRTWQVGNTIKAINLPMSSMNSWAFSENP